MLNGFKKQWKWLLPALILLIFLPFSPKLDLAVARHFYPFSQHPYFVFMYRYGEWFGFVLFFISLIVICLPKRFGMRRGALLVALSILLGAGLITNSILKQYIGRPRPVQVTEFGGTLEYRPVWQPNFDRQRIKQKSFPSGHVAMGFASLSLVLSFKPRSPFRRGAIVLTLLWGGGLMVTRVAQGGHFLSDVMVSPCVMWWTTLAVDALLHWAEGRNHKLLQRFLTQV